MSPQRRALSAIIVAAWLFTAGEPARAAERWIGTWEAAPAWADPSRSFTDTTLREVVHVSIGGGLVRVRFSNSFGTHPLAIGRVTIAPRAAGAAAAATPQLLTFGGVASILVPPGAQVLSDPVALRVRPGSDLLVSLYLSGPTGPATTHPLALQTSYSASSDRAMDKTGTAYTKTYQTWYFISGVDVGRTQAAGAVVAFGDSITDGWHSLPDKNGRWPDVLARRLSRLPPARRLGVLNAGISGNRILLDGARFGVDALARLDRDVLAQSGVKDVIMLLGINDMQQEPQQSDPRRIETGLAQIAARAHERGLRVLACTVLPAKGWYTYSQTLETTRAAVNAFIRTADAFDGVCDFDRALRDPSDPSRMLPAYDSGDHLHPNAAGQQLMGALIDDSTL